TVGRDADMRCGDTRAVLRAVEPARPSDSGLDTERPRVFLQTPQRVTGADHVEVNGSGAAVEHLRSRVEKDVDVVLRTHDPCEDHAQRRVGDPRYRWHDCVGAVAYHRDPWGLNPATRSG